MRRVELIKFRYELLFGKRPFRGRTNTALTNSILHEPLGWPEDAAERCSSSSMQAIRGVSEMYPSFGIWMFKLMR